MQKRGSIASSRTEARIKTPVTAERWRRIDELFAAALELDGSALPQFLDQHCAGDPALRAEVESMLAFAHASKDFLETPVVIEATEVWPMASTPSTPSTGSRRHEMDNNARFIPGDVVAGRYRVVGLLGRGGMGEVYRADDLKLSQPVALKFLSESLSSNGAALARFHREVSLARQISHRHVCRVYDIGEHAGMHFLSMEFVRGEELASLLKRIGRLPLDKAIETARQLCAGLAAIHAAGVLHRDLKPANVMIDEHGDVRITDFGVAALSEGVSGREAMVGTPAYMAPEQLAGGELTTRSDLYALGLVLYEAFTGNRPFTSTAVADIVRDRLGDTAPTTPSSWVADLPPLVDRVVLRCLEKDPERRPASALQVAAALPGGDPLAAALAAGETPSPQMVAAAPREGSLRPLSAMLLLLWITFGFVGMALLSDSTALHHFIALPQSPELLRARAADIAADAGYGTAVDSESRFTLDGPAFEYVRTGATATASPAQKTDEDRWSRFRASPLPVLQFWYRGSPVPLLPDDAWIVTPDLPQNTISGMTRMRLDSFGRLLYFEGAPPQEEQQAAAGTVRPDWSRFFDRAGLTMGEFRPATPRWTPPQHSDERLSWTGVHPARPEVPLRIEAASYRGKPVWFEVVWPWQSPTRDLKGAPPVVGFWIALLCLYFGSMALAVLLAWKNIRLGRGDRRGTFRLMLFIFVSRLIYWLFAAHHVRAAEELLLFMMALQSALYWAALLGLLYLALEPFVRRRWPELLISWSRFLAGDLRDPLVGRHILIGGAFGVAAIIAGQLAVLAPAMLGRPLRVPSVNSGLIYEWGLAGVRGFGTQSMNQITGSLMFSFIILSLVLFFALVTRRSAVAFGVTWLLLYVVLTLKVPDATPLDYALGLVVPTLVITALARHGLLSLIAFFYFLHLWTFYPVTTEVSAWYATSFLLQLALVAAITLFAFRVSLAGQKLVGASFLDE